MAWNDGVTKELKEYFDEIGSYGELAVEAIQEQVDIEVHKLVLQLEATTPKGATLGLLNSLRNAKITTRKSWYGYYVEFEGQNRKGVPYQRIANILNYGTSYIKGTRFVTKAIHNLKGMDQRIYERFKKKINK